MYAPLRARAQQRAARGISSSAAWRAITARNISARHARGEHIVQAGARALRCRALRAPQHQSLATRNLAHALAQKISGKHISRKKRFFTTSKLSRQQQHQRRRRQRHAAARRAAGMRRHATAALPAQHDASERRAARRNAAQQPRETHRDARQRLRRQTSLKRPRLAAKNLIASGISETQSSIGPAAEESCLSR